MGHLYREQRDDKSQTSSTYVEKIISQGIKRFVRDRYNNNELGYITHGIY